MARLENCFIIKNSEYGVVTRGSAAPIIQNCIIADNGKLWY